MVSPVMTNVNSSSDNSCFFLEINLEVPLYVYAINIATSVVNGVTSLLATIANSLVIVAICRNALLRTPSNILLSCLGFSDLMVGLASQPAYIGYKVGENRRDFQLHCFAQLVAELTGWTASGVSFLTLTVIGLQRYISLYRPLRYHAIVTTRKALRVILYVWFGFILFEASRFFFLDSNSASYMIIAMITVCLSICFWAYWKIYILARRHQNWVHDIACLKARLHGVNASVTVQRERKAARAMVGVFLLVLIGYFPLMCCLAVFQVSSFTVPVKAAFTLASTAAFVNSSVNPLLYCWRFREIRKEMRKLLCFKVTRGTHFTTVSTFGIAYNKNRGLEQSKTHPK